MKVARQKAKQRAVRASGIRVILSARIEPCPPVETIKNTMQIPVCMIDDERLMRHAAMAMWLHYEERQEERRKAAAGK